MKSLYPSAGLVLGCRILILLYGFGHQHFLSRSHRSHRSIGPKSHNLAPWHPTKKIALIHKSIREKKNSEETQLKTHTEAHQSILPLMILSIYCFWFHGSKIPLNNLHPQ